MSSVPQAGVGQPRQPHEAMTASPAQARACRTDPWSAVDRHRVRAGCCLLPGAHQCPSSRCAACSLSTQVLKPLPGACSCFGELALLYSAPRAATVRTITECALWVMDRAVYSPIKQAYMEQLAADKRKMINRVPMLAVLSEVGCGRSMLCRRLCPQRKPAALPAALESVQQVPPGQAGVVSRGGVASPAPVTPALCAHDEHSNWYHCRSMRLLTGTQGDSV